ncbi:hypothetical protein BASA83_008452 [Batrachochytrium salamandrivorans]|nr:hypothetical protein BASA83_008452 [Batrachochytrium salamandrivorans]
MHLVSDAHGYPMFAKACWESIKAAYTSASITDGMDLYRDLNKVSYDPSLGVAKLLDQMDLLRRKLAVAAVTLPIKFGSVWLPPSYWMAVMPWLSCRGTIKNLQPNELHPSQFRNFLLKEERVLIDARVLGMPQSCDTALFNNNGISNHNRGFNGISSQHRINNSSRHYIKDKQDQSLAVSSIIKSSKTNRTIYDKYGNVAFTANRHNNFNKLNRKIVIPIKGTIIKDKQDQSLAVSSTFKSPATISVWNQRLGHLSDSGIQTLTKRAQGLDIIPNKQGNSIKFEPCISGKAHRAPFPTPITTITTKANQILHMDLAKPINVASANHVKQVKLETIIPAKAIRSNNDGKFKSQDSDAFLTSKETSRQLATPHIPQQNGTTERKNQNIMDSARSMVTKSAHALRTPALITKLKLRTMQCIMLGYATGAKAYRLLNSSTNTIITCCDAFFKETKKQNYFYIFNEGSRTHSHMFECKGH